MKFEKQIQAVQKYPVMEDWPDPQRWHVKVDEKLPVFVDYSVNVKRIYNQGAEGSCVGFGYKMAIQVMRFFDDHAWPEFSARGIYDMAKVIDNDELGEEDYLKQSGTTLAAASRVVKKYAVVPDGDLGYVPNEEVLLTEETWVQLMSLGRPNCISEYRSIMVKGSLIDSLKYAVWKGFAVPIGWWISDGWLTVGTDGIVTEQGGNLGGHCVTAVGYSDATQRFKIVNSWGPGWGQKGFGYLPYSAVKPRLISGYMLT